MNIRQEYPPIIDQIAAVFPEARGSTVVFSWGDTIYSPGSKILAPEILKHEEAHGKRQLEFGVEKWWEEYLKNYEFRLAEEVIGHRAEYRDLCRQSADRNRRNLYLINVSSKLASPLYGNMVTLKEAQKLIRS